MHFQGDTIPLMDIQTVTIQKYSLKGEGIGFINEDPITPIYVPHSVIGDVITAALTKKRKGSRKGRLESIITPSPMRTATRCKHATLCGGCCWQQIVYAQQLAEKETLVKRAFSQLEGNYTSFPIIPSLDPWYYRNKMEFSFSENRGGTKYLGLMIAGAKHFVFNLEECFLGGTWFADLLCHVKTDWWDAHPELKAYNYNDGSGLLRALTLREGKYTHHKLAMLTISGNVPFPEEALDSFTDLLRKYFEKNQDTYSVYLQKVFIEKNKRTQIEKLLLCGVPEIEEEIHLEVNGKKSVLSFSISPDSFFQPNTFQAGGLYSRAIELSGVKPGSIVYDLYCGTGTIGMAFAPFAKKVIAIELNEQAVIDAKKNLLKNHITNVEILCGDVGKTIERLQVDQTNFAKPDLVIVDPPRAGLDPRAIAQLLQMHPQTIVYISCNPQTQAENIQELQEQYQLMSLQPVDQFSHTFHLENIAILQRRDF